MWLKCQKMLLGSSRNNDVTEVILYVNGLNFLAFQKVWGESVFNGVGVSQCLFVYFTNL